MHKLLRFKKNTPPITCSQRVMACLTSSIVAVAFLLLMASSSWATPIIYPMAIADIEIDDTLPDRGLVINLISDQVTVNDLTTVDRLIPAGESPGAILLADFLTDISYVGFFDSAFVAGQIIPDTFGLSSFLVGSSAAAVNEVSGARTSDALIIGDDPFNDYLLLTILAGTLEITDYTLVTVTNYFLDVNTIGYSDSAPVPEPATMVLFATGLAGFAGNFLRRKRKA